MPDDLNPKEEVGKKSVDSLLKISNKQKTKISRQKDDGFLCSTKSQINMSEGAVARSSTDPEKAVEID